LSSFQNVDHPRRRYWKIEPKKKKKKKRKKEVKRRILVDRRALK